MDEALIHMQPAGTGGRLERYRTQVALGRTQAVRRRLGEPVCQVLDAHAAVGRGHDGASVFVAALKDFKATLAQDQQALLHEVDAGLHRALQRRARRVGDNAQRMGAELLHWWACKVDHLCSQDHPLVACATLHLLWAHVLTGQVIDASAARPRDKATPAGPRPPVLPDAGPLAVMQAARWN